MKPKDLNPAFPRTDQRVIISDKVWYAPETQIKEDEFIFPGWHDPALFGNTQPVIVEYCSGNGAWIAQRALENPHINWVAVEMKFARVRKIWSKIKNLSLTNLVVIYSEAHFVTSRYIPEESVNEIFINFPDPWPKKRHAKHRLFQDQFANQLFRILKEGKSFKFVTDDVPYSDWVIQVMNRHLGFTSKYPDPYFLHEEDNYGTSYFDELWRSKGRLIRYHCFKKV